jgi:putative nucleotidyltransferase with HDIG domain
MTENTEEYRRVVEELEGQLPSIPLIMDELLRIVANPDAALFAVRDILKLDKSIYAKILRIANSVANREGVVDRISEITEAMQRIGLEKVKQIALQNSVFKIFEEEKNGLSYNLECLWMHSVGVALASQSLADDLESQLSENAYACGLLHDIGKVAKFKDSPKSFFKEVRYSMKKKESSHSSESKRSFLKHDLLGALIIEKWGLSEIVENTTRWHHTLHRNDRMNIEDPSMHKLIDIVILANHYIHELEFGNSGHQSPAPLPADFLKRLRLTSELSEVCKEKVRITLEEEAEFTAIFLQSN